MEHESLIFPRFKSTHMRWSRQIQRTLTIYCTS